MPRIIRAEFLSYYNARRNSDKLFNVFLIEDDDGTYRCVSEYGRRGNNLVRDTLCTRATREFAESKLRQKLNAKRDHRETPYSDEPLGQNYSPLAREHGYNNRTQNDDSDRGTQPLASRNAGAPAAKIISFPVENKKPERNKQTQAGILNREQFDSLEI